MLEFRFDIICLSESKILKNCDPKIDISIDGYQSPVGTLTESAKCGVLIYVKNCINFIHRNDLAIYKSKELESFFIEIINPKETNSVVHHHPSSSCGLGRDVVHNFLPGGAIIHCRFEVIIL